MMLIVIAGLLMAVGAFYLFLAIRSKDPDNLVSVTGELVRVKQYRNYRWGRSFTVPYASEYAYAYVVKGKQYLHSGVVRGRKRQLLKKVTIVYLKSFPRVSYLDCFTGYREQCAGIISVVLGVITLLLCLLISINGHLT